MQITEIKQKKYSKNIYIVYVDNEFFAQLMDETIVKFHLEKGKDVTPEFLTQVQKEGSIPLALNSALNLLEKFSKTTKDMERYLLEKGFNKETTHIVLEKLTQNNLLNDKQFAEYYVESHHNKGKKALSFELKLKGIDETIINDVLDKIESQEETIFNLAQKFIRNKKNDPKLKEKLFRHLASKGFEFDDINKVLTKVLGEKE